MKKLTLLLVVKSLLLTVTVPAQWTGALVPDFKVNDDLTTATQTEGALGLDGYGNFVIAWTDMRINWWGQVFCQRYNANAQPIGINFRIGLDTANGPDVAVLKDGRFIVVWGATLSDTSRLYCQRFFANATPNGQIIKVNDTNIFSIGSRSIGADSIGNFVCAWVDHRNGLLNADIYCQKFDSSGNKVGVNFRANDDTTTKSQEYSSLAVFKDGTFIVCWQDQRSPAINRSDIYMQKYDKDGNPVGTNQLVNDNTNNVLQSGPRFSSNAAGKFMIAWKDGRNEYIGPNGEIYFQIYDSLGYKVGVNKRADEPTNQLKNGVRCAMKEDGKFIIIWNDWRQGRSIEYAQRLDNIGNRMGNNFVVPVYTNFTNSGISDVSIFGDRIHSVWVDNRTGNFDIWCNVRSFQNPDSTIGIKKLSNEIPSEFKLFQNCPNPFNPFTTIKFDIPAKVKSEKSKVKILVYDILGTEVMTLVNQLLKSGVYEVVWDASNYPSGVYFYRLTADGFTETGKMVLLR